MWALGDLVRLFRPHVDVHNGTTRTISLPATREATPRLSNRDRLEGTRNRELDASCPREYRSRLVLTRVKVNDRFSTLTLSLVSEGELLPDRQL